MQHILLFLPPSLPSSQGEVAHSALFVAMFSAEKRVHKAKEKDAEEKDDGEGCRQGG